MNSEGVTHTKKRGGPQPGSGRPEKPPEQKFRRAQITMTPEHFADTAKDRSGMVRRALEFYPKQEIDYCIVGIVESIGFEAYEGRVKYDLRIRFVGDAECTIWRFDGILNFGPKDTVRVTSFKSQTTVEVLNRHLKQ